MLRFRDRVLRFRDLGSSFSRFGCFVLRSSFSSASFSKLLLGVTSAGTALLARGHQDSEKALILFFLLISAGNTNYFSSDSYEG